MHFNNLPTKVTELGKETTSTYDANSNGFSQIVIELPKQSQDVEKNNDVY